eukprot:scaffold73121_cov34-Phaeocystis_antarctica.AAC.1
MALGFRSGLGFANLLALGLDLPLHTLGLALRLHRGDNHGWSPGNIVAVALHLHSRLPRLLFARLLRALRLPRALPQLLLLLGLRLGM